ncbi:hypothetical protein MCAP1_002531 [Malassezia caprae]|uniref:Origin recognition complex subunit 5 C-terminal domain-containing protein n=1 Tax=Malassezia caprae TaxID=1381934 RepID=A0AAF0IWV1_9BASI|nr:hypothetical protein MCAP1_002531 [Malassezia caprae]
MLENAAPLATGAWRECLSTIKQLVGSWDQPSPPSVFVHAPNSPQHATRLVRHTLQAQTRVDPHIRVAHVTPLVSCTSRLLFTHVLRQLGDHGDACTDAGTFVKRLRSLVAQRAKLLLAVYDAERTRDVWPEHIWEMWPLLPELARSQGRIVVVYVSLLPWSAFRTISGHTISATPICLRIARLSRDDMLALLESDAPTALQDVPPGVDTTLYNNVCAVLYDTMKMNVRDEHEMRLVCRSVWKALMAHVRDGTRPSVHALMPAMGELCRNALARVVTRTMGPDTWASEMSAQAAKKEPADEEIRAHQGMPPRTGYSALQAFLLISAFIASYNHTKADVKYFVHELGTSRKRRRSAPQKAADAALLELEGETDIWNHPQFWGPRTFTLERLLAIFHAIMADFKQDMNEDALLVPAERAERSSDKAVLHLEHVAGEFWSRSATALAELNELVRKQIIVRMSPASKLSAMHTRAKWHMRWASP